MEKETAILFYSHNNGEYRAFSNWYPCKFKLDGILFYNSEQALMYYKSFDKQYRAKIIKTHSPREAKALGRSVKLRPDWDRIKYNIMVLILEAKFLQNDDLKQLLLSTNDLPIHENCDDEWWGGGPNYKSGRDLLGKALMEVRSKIKQLEK